MVLKRLSTKTIKHVKQEVGDLELQVYHSPVTSTSPANPLHHAVLGSMPPELFKANLIEKCGQLPELDSCLTEHLGVFPGAACYPYILTSFSEINDIEKLKVLALGRTPVEILTAIRKYTGRARFIDSEYFSGVDLSNSPEVAKLLS